MSTEKEAGIQRTNKKVFFIKYDPKRYFKKKNEG
jgi:hypothetical protein